MQILTSPPALILSKAFHYYPGFNRLEVWSLGPCAFPWVLKLRSMYRVWLNRAAVTLQDRVPAVNNSLLPPHPPIFFSLSFQSCPLSINYLRWMSLIEKEQKTNSYRVTLLIRVEFEFPLLVSSALIKHRVLMTPCEMRWKLTLSASWFTSRSFSEGGSGVWTKHWTWQGRAVMVILKEYVTPEY